MTNITNVLLIAIIVVVVIVFFNNIKKENIENFAGSLSEISNEAIQNVASLYNTGNMKVTNLTATTSITSPSINSSGTMNATTSISTNGTLNVKGAANSTVGDGWTTFNDPSGKNYIRGPTQIDGTTALNGPVSMSTGQITIDANGNITLPATAKICIGSACLTQSSIQNYVSSEDKVYIKFNNNPNIGAIDGTYLGPCNAGCNGNGAYFMPDSNRGAGLSIIKHT